MNQNVQIYIYTNSNKEFKSNNFHTKVELIPTTRTHNTRFYNINNLKILHLKIVLKKKTAIKLNNYSKKLCVGKILT